MEFEQAKAIANDAIVTNAGRPLSEAEIAILSAAWNDQTYEEVADRSGYSLNYLQRDVGPKFWKLLSAAFDRKLSKTNVRGILEQQFGEKERQKAGGRRQEDSLDLEVFEKLRDLKCQIDWGESPDIAIFYGREQELVKLTEWIEQDRCRLVGVLGMGGIGKSSLAARLTSQLQNQFEVVIWRSLRNAPPLETLLTELVPFLSQQQDTQAKTRTLTALVADSSLPGDSG